jgi:hypothetical protein
MGSCKWTYCKKALVQQWREEKHFGNLPVFRPSVQILGDYTQAA